MTTPPETLRRRRAAWALSAVLLAAVAGGGLALRTPGARPAAGQRFVQAGVAVDWTAEPVDPARRGQPPRAGEEVAFRFTVTDAATGAPFTRLYPAAWLSERAAGAPPSDVKACGEKVKAYLGGGLLDPGELDLNLYQVLVLNEDPTISVVDPRFGFGGSRLLGMVFLRSPGSDWALTADDARLFVAMPDSERVAVVDPVSYRVTRELELAPRPTRLALQPDGGYLWVLSDGSGGADAPSVTVVNAADLSVVARLRTGAGAHQIAFSEDSRFAFVTNRDQATVSVVDVRALKVARELPTGRAPGSVAYSRIARAAYVADEEGFVTAVDGERQKVLARLSAGPGLGQLAFEKTGRHGFVLNPEQDSVTVIDAATNRLIQTGKLEHGPDQIAFSEGLAYVRHRGSETVLMLPLDQVGVEGKPLAAVDFPGGQHAPGAAPAAPLIVPAPGASAVLVANPVDKAIYYYREGMAAPVGNFSAYEHSPRAVRVLDRSLRERAPGVYETTARLRGPGPHELAFLLDAPRTLHCAGLDVAEDPARAKAAGSLRIQPLWPESVQAGQAARVRFRLMDPGTRAPRGDLQDLTVLAYQAAGNWHARGLASPEPDGTYGVDLVPPTPGVYYLALESRSAGMRLDSPQGLTLIARGGTP